MLEVDKRRGVLIVEADGTPLKFATVVLKTAFWCVQCLEPRQKLRGLSRRDAGLSDWHGGQSWSPEANANLSCVQQAQLRRWSVATRLPSDSATTVYQTDPKVLQHSQSAERETLATVNLLQDDLWRASCGVFVHDSFTFRQFEAVQFSSTGKLPEK